LGSRPLTHGGHRIFFSRDLSPPFRCLLRTLFTKIVDSELLTGISFLADFVFGFSFGDFISFGRSSL